MSNSTTTAPDVLLLTATGCPHCPIVHKIFLQLKDKGKLGNFEVINISQQPQAAEKYGVRSVPWFRIGDLEFQGLHSATELEFWVDHANSDEGIRKYLIDELEVGHLPAVEKLLSAHPAWLEMSLSIVADMEAPIQARIGLGAIFESLQGTSQLKELIPALTELSRHSDQRVRGDACYYLGLASDSAARPALQACLNDSAAEVREIAAEALESLSD